MLGRGLRGAGCLIGVTAVTLLTAASAQAGTARVVRASDERKPVVGVEYLARSGERNVVTAALAAKGRGAAQLTLTDTAGVTAGRGCVATPGSTTRVVCTFGSARQPAAATVLGMELGDGNDRASFTTSSAAYGAAIAGGTGRDRLTGGKGEDLFIEGTENSNGADVLDGGPGLDLVSYAGRRSAVRVTLAGSKADDGQRGEGDRVVRTEGAEGGDGNDSLIGTSGPNILIGGGGTDTLTGGAGDDALTAGGTRKALAARTADRLSGGAGTDELVGSDGPNRLDGGTGADRVIGRGGRDVIVARDAFSDDVSCGASVDTVVSDSFDFVRSGCERLQRKGLPRAALLPLPLFVAQAGAARLPVSIGCPADTRRTCAVRVRLSVGSTRLGSAALNLAPGRARTTSVRLSRAGRARLRRASGRSVIARYVILTRLRGGATRSITAAVPLPVLPPS